VIPWEKPVSIGWRDWTRNLGKPRQALRMLKEEGLPSVRQIRVIDEQRAAFGNSCARMLEEWEAFSERPRDDSTRQEFFHALSHVQPTKDFRPEEFC